MIGNIYGKWRVLRKAMSCKRSKWVCKCECGKEKCVRGDILTAGKSKSCGCNTNIWKLRTTHAQTRSITYRSWMGMKRRGTGCEHKKNYADRGIDLCASWHKFENFLSDMGERPSLQYSIERIDNSKGYSKDNCKWATKKEQQSNTRRNVFIEVDGIKQTLAEALRIFKIEPRTFSYIKKSRDYCHQEAFNEIVLERGLRPNYE